MASKAARKKRRLEEERRQLESLDARETGHTQCSDVALAQLEVLLGEAHELLGRVITHATRARATWPQVPAAYELRATIDEVGAAAASSRAKLAAAHERTRRFHRSGVHVHLCGDLAVRMVPLVAQRADATVPRVDDEYARDGDAFGMPSADDTPF